MSTPHSFSCAKGVIGRNVTQDNWKEHTIRTQLAIAPAGTHNTSAARGPMMDHTRESMKKIHLCAHFSSGQRLPQRTKADSMQRYLRTGSGQKNLHGAIGETTDNRTYCPDGEFCAPVSSISLNISAAKICETIYLMMRSHGHSEYSI